VKATIGCGISHKGQNKSNTNNMTKPQTNTFSKYCKENAKEFDIQYTHNIQSPYNKTIRKKSVAYI
jgi:hypothetical protein